VTIEITKAKLTRWIIIVALLLCSSVEADDIPRVVERIGQCSAFMSQFQVKYYKDYALHDVYELREGLFYVVMFCKAGIQETFAFDTRKGKTEVVWRDMYIFPKTVRGKLMRECVTITDAVKIALAVEAAKAAEKEAKQPDGH
jgi:hypothetical protein